MPCTVNLYVWHCSPRGVKKLIYILSDEVFSDGEDDDDDDDDDSLGFGAMSTRRYMSTFRRNRLSLSSRLKWRLGKWREDWRKGRLRDSQHRYFNPEDEDVCFSETLVFYQRVHMTPKPRRTLLSIERFYVIPVCMLLLTIVGLQLRNSTRILSCNTYRTRLATF
jgi:hypothetical protein